MTARTRSGMKLAAAGSILAIMATPHKASAQTPSGAQPAPAPAAPNTPTPSATPAGWGSKISLGVQVDGGITGNFDRPSDGLNYGRLFDDKANTALLNQVQLTALRPIDSGASGYDFGFTLQGTYGSDARYLHYLGEFNYAITQRYQFALVQANLLAHAPWLSSGGIDFKLGQFVTPIGYETIDPSTNPFYSHSYMFNFGPFSHTGLLAVWHATPMIDVYLQGDTGESTTFDGGDNNGEPGGLVGIGLNNLLGGKLTLLLLSHMGPENAIRNDPQANSQMRYENDLLATYKPTPKLTLVTEVNVQHDESAGADSYGAAQYVSYALTSTLTANFRAEVYRDNGAFFVSAYPRNTDFVSFASGRPNTAYAAQRTTYSEFTWGLTYKPSIPHVATLMFRPELRWDKSLSGTHPYNGLSDNGMFTLAADVVLGF